MQITVCDACGKPVDKDGPFSEESWITAAVGFDEPPGHAKDYHRKCARTVTLAEVWKRNGLVDL